MYNQTLDDMFNPEFDDWLQESFNWDCILDGDCRDSVRMLCGADS